jgi:hypothetical protein
MISTALYAARTVLLIPVIAVGALLWLPCWLARSVFYRRPRHLAELMARDAAMAERIRLHQLEKDRRAACRKSRRQLRRVL